MSTTLQIPETRVSHEPDIKKNMRRYEIEILLNNTFKLSVQK